MRRRVRGEQPLWLFSPHPVKTYKSLEALATNHLDRILDVPVET